MGTSRRLLVTLLTLFAPTFLVSCTDPVLPAGNDDSAAENEALRSYLNLAAGRKWIYNVTADDEDDDIHGTGPLTVEVLSADGYRYHMRKVEVINGQEHERKDWAIRIENGEAFCDITGNQGDFAFSLLTGDSPTTTFVSFFLMPEDGWGAHHATQRIDGDTIQRDFVSSEASERLGYTCGTDWEIHETSSKDVGTTEFRFHSLFACFGVNSSVEVTYTYELAEVQ